MEQKFIDTDELPQINNEAGGDEMENSDKGLWCVGAFLLALVTLAAVLAMI